MSKLGPQFYVLEPSSECPTAGFVVQPTDSPQGASSEVFLGLFITPRLSASHNCLERGQRASGAALRGGVLAAVSRLRVGSV